MVLAMKADGTVENLLQREMQLLPCPFCGGMAISAGLNARCVKCDATGPMGRSEANGLDLWDARPEQQ
jgi:hypothetical protein